MNRQPVQTLMRVILSLALVSILVSSCRSAALEPTTATRRLPLTESPSAEHMNWQSADPEMLGIDSQELADLLTTLHNDESGVNALLIMRHGIIAVEVYFAPFTAGSRQQLFSITKSVISALIGIALTEGKIESLDQPVLSFFPDRIFENVDARKERMTLRDLLTMSSGLEWHEAAPYTEDSLGRMVRSTDWVQFILDQPMAAEPGEVFAYNSGVSHLLSAILQQSTGKTAYAYAKEKLFEPMGFPAVPWRTDPQGRSIGGWGLELTTREMAAIGYLYLHQGRWEGQQLVPVDWVAESTTRHSSEESGRLGYGYQWWTLPELSPTAYSAIGRLVQYIIVIPEQDAVVVFASADAKTDLVTLTRTSILPAIQSDTALPANPEAAEALQDILNKISRAE